MQKVKETKKTKRFRSLKVNLIIAFISLSGVILLISSGLDTYINFCNQQKLIAHQQQLTAQNAAYIVRGFVQEKLGILERTVAVGNLANARPKEQKLALEKLLGKVPSFRQLVLLNTEKQELIRVSRMSSLLEGLLNADNISIIFSETMLGKTFISPVYIDAITSEPVIIISVQVMDTLGNFRGILMAEVNLKFIWDLVDSIKIGKKGLAYVVDKRGDLIAFGDVSRVLKRENLKYLKEVNEFVKGDIKYHKESAEIVRGIQGGLVVANHAHLGVPDWAVVVELPIREAYASVIEGLQLSALVLLLSFAFAVLFGAYLSRKITEPIITLRDATKSVSKGNLSPKIELGSKDEIGELAVSFNQMVKDLHETTVSINELKKEQKRFQDIAVSAREWIWEIDAEGRYIYANPVVKDILGYRPEEVLGRYFYDFFHPADREELKRVALQAFSRKEEFRDMLNRNMHKDGHDVILETSAVPVIDADGKLVGYRGVNRDITERKKAEEELKQAYEQLKQVQAQLVQSAKMASVGLLAGGVAHEINNPLTGVLNNVQLIKMIAERKKGFSLDDFKDLLNLIEESAQRCSRIVRSLLGFSRASKGVFQNLSLNEMVEKVIVLIEHELGLQNIAIQTELAPDLSQVKGDPQLLQQLIFDIINNAKWAIQKKEEKRGGTITIRTRRELADKFVSISVSDNGIGIPKQNLEHLFEPFFTTKSVGEGTGLGLSIVYNIVKEHSGTITVESEVNKGTTFKILLPVFSPG